MIKAVLIDDEYIVLEGLKAIVNWEVFGIEVVGAASDGVSGLELIEKEKPDIVFTDITMPRMNGLSLIEKAKKVIPSGVFIIFSGYNEFEYARKAISLGVIDYLDKPVTIDKVEETLKEAIKIINKKKEETKLVENFLESKKAILEGLIRRLINGENVNDEKLFHILKDNNINLLNIENFTVAVAKQEDDIENHEKFISEMNRLFAHNNQNNLIRHFILNDGKEVIFTFFEMSDINNESESNLINYITETKKQLQEQNIDFYIGIGESYKQVLDIGKSYLEAKKALKYAAFKDTTSIVHISDVEYSNHISSLADDGHDSIIFNIRSSNKQEVIGQVKNFLKNLETYNLPPEMFCHECLELIYLALKVSAETGKDYVAEKEGGFIPHVEILKANTAFGISAWMISFFDDLMNWIANIQKNSNRKSIVKVREYLDENYHKDITLDEMAEMVNINSTYLSMLFKEQVGTTYIKYLTNVRLEKAKRLLNEGYKVKEVSEMVGYHNSRHFSELFKKTVGLTPDQFKGKTK